MSLLFYGGLFYTFQDFPFFTLIHFEVENPESFVNGDQSAYSPSM